MNNNIDSLMSFINEVHDEEINSRILYENVILNEGLLSRLFKNKNGKNKKGDICYYAYFDIKSNQIISNKPQIYKDQKTALLSFIASLDSIGGAIFYDNKLYLNNKTYDSFNNNYTCTLAKCEINKIKKQYGHLYYDLKVIEILYNDISIKQLLNKYSIEMIKGKVPSNVTSGRLGIYNKVLQFAKNILNEEKKPKGFTICSDNDENNISKFSIGVSNYVNIIECDAWAFTNNKARDEVEYEKYNKVFETIYKKLNEKIKENNISGELDYYGDWDDGPIVFLIKE